MSKKSSTFAAQNRVQSYNKKLKYTNNLVKKLQTYRLLLVLMLICGTVEAKVSNYFGIYAQGGEWSLMPSRSEVGMSLGGAGGAGLVYELQAGSRYGTTRFLFDVGVGAQGGVTSFRSDIPAQAAVPSIDLQGEPFDYIYDVTKRTDSYSNLAIQVPLMIGVQSGRFYMLAGVKIDANMLTKAHSTADAVTYGRYAEYGDIRHNPDVQFFDNCRIDSRSNVQMKLGMDLSLEIGGRIGAAADYSGFNANAESSIEYRLAGFVDYGISDIHYARQLPPVQSTAFYDVNPSSADYIYKTTTMVDNAQLTDIMSTNGFASKVNNLVVGLKFTVLFPLPDSSERCAICKDAYGSSVRRRGGGVKYEE